MIRQQTPLAAVLPLRSPAQPRSASLLQRWLEQYERSGRALSVNFREAADWMSYGERATHLIHPYPAKLLPHIPAFLLANEMLSQPGDVVLDPFCGSGTVLLESLLSGRFGIGFDSNPLARLVSQVKVTPIAPQRIEAELGRLLARIRKRPRSSPPSVPDVKYWYHPHAIEALLTLRDAVDETENSAVRRFFQVAFSATARKCSLADPRLSVPVKLKKNQYPQGHWLRRRTNDLLAALRTVDVVSVFSSIARSNSRRLDELRQMLPPQGRAAVVGSDARTLLDECGVFSRRNTPVASGSVSLILTSPPYLGAQKYIRASSLSLAWLRFTEQARLRDMERQNIGREHFTKNELAASSSPRSRKADSLLKEIRKENPLRSHIAATYLAEMQQAIAEMARVLRRGGHAVLVSADNQVCGRAFPTERLLREMAKQAGLAVRLRLLDTIHSRGLMTRRNSTASMISREVVTVFYKT